jgi:protein tyrosine phosphatase
MSSSFQGYNNTDEFILTQHPLEKTAGDFWRMVWDNNSSVIVLLSRADDEVRVEDGVGQQ